MNDVAITYNQDESQAVLEGLKLIEAEKLINNEDIVLIVPNWVTFSVPKSGVVVGPETFRTIIKWVKGLNPKRIVVATGSGGGDTIDIMKKVGYEKIIKEENVEFIDFNSGPYDELIIDSTVIKKLKVNKIINEKTKLISFTQLKQHEEATMSAAIKIVSMSIPSTEEHGAPKKNLGIHTDLHDFLYKMAINIPIDISIVNANPAMVGTGPSRGAAVHTGIVVSGNNPVSTDTVNARLLGFKPQAISYLYKLEQAKVGLTDFNKINLKGIPIHQAEEIFTKAIYHQKLSVDDIL
ncbi:MAG: hypothetical protein K0Q49_364 [Haloplasmataceae bacterium]|jgi:uncharacterized protein (DUF362 family)|nr:hypothetical protein [Haloplasmataceae bacterium]